MLGDARNELLNTQIPINSEYKTDTLEVVGNFQAKY